MSKSIFQQKPPMRKSRLFSMNLLLNRKICLKSLLFLRNIKAVMRKSVRRYPNPLMNQTLLSGRRCNHRSPLPKKMYKYSIVIGNYCLKIFEHVSSEPTGAQGLESSPGLAALLVKTFSFIIDFDEIKTHNSDLQNDFSYYRRSISKFKMMDKGNESVEALLTDEEANYMSLFFAQHTPMFKSLAQMLNEHIKKKPDLGTSISSYLAALAGSCYHSIMKQRVSGEDRDNIFRALVGCTILYDSIHPDGVFIKGSPIDVSLFSFVILNCFLG
ncbi:hypothetical protein DSO57_1021465 [Entomophthora muscae]|uniref:Uncharacterized protein n=1 Tax=Entomophthora muscae TaxID=34485 RepID=A0ACC2TEE1_9FUNG|nr:hypothetical protein DSO57_1021465 [Entomophthora muscae]